MPMTPLVMGENAMMPFGLFPSFLLRDPAMVEGVALFLSGSRLSAAASLAAAKEFTATFRGVEASKGELSMKASCRLRLFVELEGRLRYNTNT